uniref:Expressed conserved protein n=1 Tax=Macrostomum lignano TaxID=282301 RepID=A0A1I8FFD3_9PLAT
MHCLTDNDTTSCQLARDAACSPQPDRSTVAKPAPSTSTPAASVAVPSVANLPARPRSRCQCHSAGRAMEVAGISAHSEFRAPTRHSVCQLSSFSRTHTSLIDTTATSGKQISYSGFMDPYSSLYMQHREDRYQPYPCTYGSSRACASNCQPAPSQGGSCTQQARGLEARCSRRQRRPARQPQAYRRKLSSKKQSQPSGRGRPRPQPMTQSLSSRVQHDESLRQAAMAVQLLRDRLPRQEPVQPSQAVPRSAERLAVQRLRAASRSGVHDFNMHLVQLAHPLISALNCI